MPTAIAALGLLGAAPKQIAVDHTVAGTGAHTAMTGSPVVVTSDSPQYCHDLDARVDNALHTRAPERAPEILEARGLKHDGEVLCDEGHLRPGIAQLRRALLMIRGRPTAP